MNKDHVEGSLRSAMGQGERVVGQAMDDPRTTAQGIYDDAAGKARSALGSAEDAVSRSADAVSALDFSTLRDEVSKLTQMVADLTQRRVSAGRGHLPRPAPCGSIRATGVASARRAPSTGLE